uniref:Uncharacterized protein n=1 Tax=Ixodes ricinus TaxID=34613 RepID=A0A6B0UUR8_IXORI
MCTLSRMRALSLAMCGACSGWSRAKRGPKKASWYLAMPPLTAASITPARRMLRGAMPREGSLEKSATRRRSSWFMASTLSQACTSGGTSWRCWCTTACQGSTPGRRSSVSRVVRSIHRLLNSLSLSMGSLWMGRSNWNMRTSFTR